MSRVFTEDGRSIPVTLIEATPNRVTQLKTEASDGYNAVQVTAGTRRANLLTQPLKGHYAKAKVEPGRGLWEFRVSADDLGKYAVGAEIKADDVFSVGQIVDVRGGQDRVALDLGRQRNGTEHRGAGALGRLDDFAGRPVDQPMIVCLQPNPDLLVRHNRILLGKER
jgi:hypothetical protein